MSTRAQYNAGVQTFYDSVSFETLMAMSPIFYKTDFLGAGAMVIPAAGAAENGVDWVKKIVGAAPPTVAGVANAVGGQIACALTADGQKEDAVLYWGDDLSLDATKGLCFEARIRLSVLPSAAGVQAVFGLGSVWIDGPDNNTCYLQMGATANGALLIRSFDGVTRISAPSGVVLAAGDWATVRIEATDLTDVKMFVNGNKVTTQGQINFAAVGGLAVLQPYLGVYKPNGAGVATLLVDYVSAWMNRQ
jgi:hypothetical protein